MPAETCHRTLGTCLGTCPHHNLRVLLVVGVRWQQPPWARLPQAQHAVPPQAQRARLPQARHAVLPQAQHAVPPQAL